MAQSKNKPPHSSRIKKICLWTKFQPPTWPLALSGPIFAFRPLNNLPLYSRVSNRSPGTLINFLTFCPPRLRFSTETAILFSKFCTEGLLLCTETFKISCRRYTILLEKVTFNYWESFVYSSNLTTCK